MLITGGLLAPAAHAAAPGDLLWARSAGGSDEDIGYGISVDAAGNAVVTGYFMGSATFGAGEANETTLTGWELEMFIAKYAGAPSSEQPDLAIAKRADPLPARVGKDLTYTLTIVNQGPGDATEVVVLDWRPEKVRVVSLPDRCRLIRRETVRCALESLAAGAEIQLEIVVRPKKPGLLVNRATVKAAEADLNEADNAVTLRTRVRGCGSSCDDDHPGKHHDDDNDEDDEDEDHQRH